MTYRDLNTKHSINNWEMRSVDGNIPAIWLFPSSLSDIALHFFVKYDTTLPYYAKFKFGSCLYGYINLNVANYGISIRFGGKTKTCSFYSTKLWTRAGMSQFAVLHWLLVRHNRDCVGKPRPVCDSNYDMWYQEADWCK